MLNFRLKLDNPPEHGDEFACYGHDGGSDFSREDVEVTEESMSFPPAIRFATMLLAKRMKADVFLWWDDSSSINIEIDGFVHKIEKPTSFVEALAQKFAKWIKLYEAGKIGLKILIVEERDYLARLAEIALLDEGFEVRTAQQSGEAVKIATTWAP